jgi:hypothetical protein
LAIFLRKVDRIEGTFFQVDFDFKTGKHMKGSHEDYLLRKEATAFYKDFKKLTGQNFIDVRSSQSVVRSKDFELMKAVYDKLLLHDPKVATFCEATVINRKTNT